MKEISITYTQTANGSANAILLQYNIEKEQNNLTVNCSVVSSYPEVYTWMRVRKFKMKALLQDKKYTALFEEDNTHTSVDMTLFMDHAYNTIMKKEKLAMTASL